MNKCLLIINAGSSSIKFTVYGLGKQYELNLEITGQIEGIGNQPNFRVSNSQDEVLVERKFSDNDVANHEAGTVIIHSWLFEFLGDRGLLALGHRVVHGGLHYLAPVLIDANVLNDLESLIPLAPIHQPHNLNAVRAFQKIMPNLPQVACFDTAFHHTQPEIAQRFALPRRFFLEGIRHYGFHGISYEYIASILPTLNPKLAQARVIVAHLGNGASLCAMENGSSLATTMGFSPLDGLVMGTRCGNLDPGVLLYLMNHHHLDAKALEQLLYYESGLLGLSGISQDMRTLIESNDLHAREAIELFVYRISREIGSLVAALGGLDAIIFTGGIGEHSAEIRSKISQQLAWLGASIDDSLNQASARNISASTSKISLWVVQTNENLMIALHTKQLILKKEMIGC